MFEETLTSEEGEKLQIGFAVCGCCAQEVKQRLDHARDRPRAYAKALFDLQVRFDPISLKRQLGLQITERDLVIKDC